MPRCCWLMTLCLLTRRLCQIFYEDGDKEDMTAREVQRQAISLVSAADFRKRQREQRQQHRLAQQQKRRLEKDLKTTSSGGVARSWHLTHPFVSADFRQHEHLLHARFDVNMSGPKHFALCLCCVCASCAIAIGALHPSFGA